jgi:eukaryotic-like serine/threonine-protein kinase
VVDSQEVSQIGRYQVLGRLATGGMAELLLGRLHSSHGFERPVALKRVLPHLVRQRGFAAMLVDEARISASIRHPNVVSIFELVEGDDELCIVMEYLEGEHLGTLLRTARSRNEQLPVPLVMHLISEASAGLHAAHEAVDQQGHPLDLVHRDVSPQNVFVTYSGGVKILDFGVALASGRLVRTETGLLKGKLNYMSPEQVKSGDLDRRADIFSLGIVLWETLTGRSLFRRESPAGTIQAILDEEIVPPSHFRDDVSQAMDAVCLQALSRDPATRFQDALSFRRALRGLSRPAVTPPDELLAQLMVNYFQDGQLAKQELLRQAVEGRVEAQLVQSVARREEVDPLTPDLVEREPRAVPRLQATPHSQQMRISEAQNKYPESDAPSSSKMAWVVFALFTLAGLAVGLYFLLASTEEHMPESVVTSAVITPPVPAKVVQGAVKPTEEPVEAVANATPEPTAPPDEKTAVVDERTNVVVPPVTAIAAPPTPVVELVTLEVKTTPSGAQVRLGNLSGVTPWVIKVPRTNKALTLTVKKAGYVPLKEVWVPSSNERRSLSLQPVPKVRKKTSKEEEEVEDDPLTEKWQ